VKVLRENEIRNELGRHLSPHAQIQYFDDGRESHCEVGERLL
jgi:hypothetical protein